MSGLLILLLLINTMQSTTTNATKQIETTTDINITYFLANGLASLRSFVADIISRGVLLSFVDIISLMP